MPCRGHASIATYGTLHHEGMEWVSTCRTAVIPVVETETTADPQGRALVGVGIVNVNGYVYVNDFGGD